MDKENNLDSLISTLTSTNNRSSQLGRRGAMTDKETAIENRRSQLVKNAKEMAFYASHRSSSASSDSEFIPNKDLSRLKEQISSREEIRRNKEPKNNSENLKCFEGKIFTFIPYGLELTSKRIQILTQNVTKRAGIVIPYANFVWDPARNSQVLVTISKEMSYEVFKKVVPAIFHQEIDSFQIIDCDWISVCLQKQRCVSLDKYTIKWKDHTSNREEFDDRKYAIKKLEVQDQELGDFVEKKLIDTTFSDHLSNNMMNSILLQDKISSIQNQQAWDAKTEYIESPIQNVFSPNQMNFEDADHDTDNNSSSIQPSDGYISLNSSFISLRASPDKIKNNERMEEERNFKKEELTVKDDVKKESQELKSDLNIKTKQEIPLKIEVGKPRNYMYVLSDDDDEVILVGANKKRMKLEEDDVRGTFLEGLSDLDKINTNRDGEVVELKDYKYYTRSVKTENHDDKIILEEKGHQKEEILLCQPEAETNQNIHITKELERMYRVYQLLQDKGRKHGYGKAISILKAIPNKITTVEEARNINGLGSRMIRHITEILTKGRLSQADKILSTEKMQVLQLFDEIYGVGPTIAIQFYNKGLRTLEDLRRNEEILNDSQRLGLRYYDEFCQKIPREQVTEIYEVVRAKIEEISDYKEQYESICGGSYRRGRALCGDVDIILSPRNGDYSLEFLTKLVKSLEASLLTDHLSMPKSHEVDGQTYLGVCLYRGIHRRIDFKIVPRERFGALTIYYTGGDYFNRSMRIVAEKQGYILDNYGLHHGIRVGETKHPLNLIPCYTEHDVFRVLGLKYIPPTHRDI